MIHYTGTGSVRFGGRYEYSFDMLEAILIQRGAKSVEADIDSGKIFGRFVSRSGLSVLCINAQFRRTAGDLIELSVSVECGDAVDAVDYGNQLAQEVLKAFVAHHGKRQN